MDLPDFLSFALRTAVRMRLGETRLIGAVTPTSEQVSGGVAEDWIDLAFLWTAPMPRRLGATTPQVLALKRQPIATIAVFSLDEGQARALELVRARAEQKPEDIPQAVEDLWDAAASGEVLLSACASLAQNSGNSSRIWAVREWAALAEAPTEHVPVGASVMPSKATTFIKAFNSGTTWEVQCVEDGADGRIDLEFVHDVAPPVLVAFEEGKARNGEAKEAPLQPTTFALSLKTNTCFKSDVPQLLAIEKSPAPPGHPEHGRWLVAVLKVVSSGK